jgi:hypothetical protein
MTALLNRQQGDRSQQIHKRKMPVKVKLANWCCDWPVADSIAPVMVLLFDRAKKGLSPQNAFEKDIYNFLQSLDKKHTDAFQIGVDAYHAIPEGRRCAVETRFDDWPDDRPVDPDFVGKVIMKELLALGRYGIFAKKDGQASVGEMRLWAPPVITRPDGNTPPPLLGPFPWICAINPGADNKEWYRNREYVVPDKSDIASVAFDLHEFSIECEATTDKDNPKIINIDCKDKVLGGGPGSFQVCDGGGNYEYKPSVTAGLRCLTIPRCVAGQGVALRGFNFLSLESTVVIKKLGGGFPDMILPCDVMGDDNPPSKNASCSIRDIATFALPKSIRDGLNDRVVPTGRYSVEIHVPNESSYAPEPGAAPKEFVSNTALIEIIPPLDIQYQVWAERGNCYEETSGPGDDEPWFRSYTASYRAVGKQVLESTSRDIFQQEDIESGDWIGFSPVTSFDGKLERDGVVAIAILGLEVDSEDAAKEQITDFGDAYALYFKQLLTGAASAGAGGLFGKGLGTLVDKGIVTASLVVGGIALAAIAVAGLFYAAWAPADPIGYDLLVFDQVTLFNLVTPGGSPRNHGEGNIGDITWSSYPKGFTIKAANVAEYREERQYRSDDEESKYGLDFMVTRLP